MLRKLCFVLGMLLIVCLPYSSAVSAQLAAEPPPPPTPSAPGHLALNAFATGLPGTNFRYVSMLGVSEVPFLADTDHLNKPNGIFIDNANNLFVAEGGSFRVLKFSPTGEALLTLGRAGMSYNGTGTDIAFTNPKDIAIDAAGNIWVVDDSRIVKFNSSGVYQLQLPATNSLEYGTGNTQFTAAGGIAVDGMDRLFVGDSGNNRVQVYNISTGSPVYLATIGALASGTDNTHFNQPLKLATDSQNRLYVVDFNNNRVQRCTENTVTKVWGCLPFASSLKNPQGIWISSDDTVYIADTNNGQILKCTGAGVCTTLVTQTWASDVGVDTAGNVYAVASFEGVIRKYSSAGAPLENFKGTAGVGYLTDTSHFYRPHVAVDRQDNLLIIENMGQRITKRSPDGTWLWSYGVAGYDAMDDGYLSYPLHAAAGPDGRIYVANNMNIVILDSAGHLVGKIGAGVWGEGNDQFKAASGIAVDDSNRVFVADSGNHRVQVYDGNGTHITTLGVTGVAGSDAGHFANPQGVDVDEAGNIYVADFNNCRVQKFNSSLAYVMTFGQPGCTTPYNLGVTYYPTDVAVDDLGRLYVAGWDSSVKVFDASGAFLTSLGGGRGGGMAQYRGESSVDVDSKGNVYIGDSGNHRVMKYASGVLNWRQININGFGELANTGAGAAEVFQGTLYVGTHNKDYGATIWRTSDRKTWAPVTDYRFGETVGNTRVMDMAVYGDRLYACTGQSESNTAQVWYSLDGFVWSKEGTNGFGDAQNNSFYTFAAFKNALYLSTGNTTATRTHGAVIYRKATATSSWQPVYTSTNTNDQAIVAFAEFGGYLYVGVENPVSGAKIIRTQNGSTWDTSPMTGGFGSAQNQSITSLTVFGGYLYATTGTNGSVPGQVYRSSNGTTWEPVSVPGTETAGSFDTLVSYRNSLYLFLNHASGVQVWRSGNGVNWKQINPSGFVGPNNVNTGVGQNGSTVFQGQLIQTVANDGNGGGVWEMLPDLVIPYIGR